MEHSDKRRLMKHPWNMPTFRAAWAHLLFMEKLTFCTCAVCLLLIKIFNVTLFFPDFRSFLFLFDHYISPVLIGTAALTFIFTLTKPKHIPGAGFFTSIRITLSITAVIIIHFNFKLWAMLINPLRFDSVYLKVDNIFYPFERVAQPGMEVLNTFLHMLLKNPYGELFVAQFFVVIIALALLRPWSNSAYKLMNAIALVLILGSIGYMLFPAFGPFIFEKGYSAEATGVQRRMYSFYRDFLAIDGKYVIPGCFTGPLAAMPSLHVGHTWVFTWYLNKSSRYLGIAGMFLLFYFMLESTLSNWHYWCDFFPGILIGHAAIYLSERFSERPAI